MLSASTGDIKNNLEKLSSELKQIHYPSVLDSFGCTRGDPVAFLPLLHYVLVDYSPNLSQYLVSKNYEFFGKTDTRFIDLVYKLCRDEFNYKPEVKKDQFFMTGFAERKMIFIMNLIQFCLELNRGLVRRFGVDKKKSRGPVQIVNEPSTESEEIEHSIMMQRDEGVSFALGEAVDLSFYNASYMLHERRDIPKPITPPIMEDRDSTVGSHEDLPEVTEFKSEMIQEVHPEERHVSVQNFESELLNQKIDLILERQNELFNLLQSFNERFDKLETKIQASTRTTEYPTNFASSIASFSTTVRPKNIQDFNAEDYLKRLEERLQKTRLLLNN